MNSRDITSTGTGPTWNGTVLNKSGSSLCWYRKKWSCLFMEEARLIANTNLDSRTVICVEPPHATTAGATCPHRATTLGGSLPCTLPYSSSSWKVYNQVSYQGAGQLTISSSTLLDFKLLAQTCSWRAASSSPWTARPNTGRTSCRSRHPQSKVCLLWNNWTISHVSLPYLAFSHIFGTLKLEYRYWALL